MDSSFLNEFLAHGIYPGTVIILILCGMGLPLPEELIFLTVGLIGAKQDCNVWFLSLAGLIGIMLGDSIPFFLGHRYGLSLVNRPFFARFLTNERIDRVRAFFQKHGSKTVFAARFVAGLRMPTFFMAGAMGVPYWRFFLWDLLGAMISCPTTIWLSHRFGKAVASELLENSKGYVILFVGLIALYTVLHIWWGRRKRRLKQETGEAALQGELPAIEKKVEEKKTDLLPLKSQTTQI